MDLYGWIDIGGVFLVLTVMTLTEHDVINQVAPTWLQWVRRGSLGSLVVLLTNAVVHDNSQMSLLWIVWAGLLAMAVNAVALTLRKTKDRMGSRFPSIQRSNRGRAHQDDLPRH